MITFAIHPFAAIIIGSFVGFASLLAVIYCAQSGAERIARWWCRSPREGNDRSFRRRIAWALSPRKATMLLPLLAPFLLPWFVFAFFGENYEYLLLAFFGSYAATVLFFYPLFVRKMLVHFRQQLATHAVHKLAKIGDNAFAEDLLLKAARSTEPLMRIVATEGLQYLGTKAGNAALDKLCGDRNMQVSLAACEAARQLHRVMSGKHVMSLEPLAELLKEFELRQKVLQRDPHFQPQEAQEKMLQAEREIEKILHSQFLLRRVFPDLYCEKCHDFAEQQAHADWRWVRCKVCHEAMHLRPDIAQVIGQIGGTQSWEVKDKVLIVSLWDAESRHLIPGVVHSVEVVGGREMDYDWALSAVLEMLRNRGQHVEIRLVDGPRLSENSRNLLRAFEDGGR